MSSNIPTTKHEGRDEKGRVIKGAVLNPDGKGGFGERPEDRSNGRWDKTKVFSYQYRRFMEMSMDELNAYRALPDMERSVVEELAYNTVMRGKASLADIKEITDRTEGKAPQFIGIGGDEEYRQALVIFAGEDDDGEE